MSKGPHEIVSQSSADMPQAIELLTEALAIIDRLGFLDIGARLQEVIESLKEAQPDSGD